MRRKKISDILLYNCKYVTQENNDWILKHEDIGIHDGKIVDVSLIDITHEAIDMSHKILFPMLFNLHAHLGESIFRDITGSDWTITRYLSYTSAYHGKQRKDEQDRQWAESAVFTMREMLSHGTGGFCAARSAPIHASLHMDTMAGYPIMNSEKLKRFQVEGIGGFDRYRQQHRDETCAVGIFFHSLYMTDANSLRFAAECMERGAEFLSVHLSEDSITREKEMKRYGKGPAFVLDDHGLLTEKTILVHCGFVSEAELELIGRRGACIAICPLSNLFLNTKIIHPERLQRHGIRWSICTDGLATGRSLSLQDQICCFQRIYPNVSDEQLLRSVTVIPAALYGRKHYTGKIGAGVSARFNQLEADADSVHDALWLFLAHGQHVSVVDFR